MILWETQHSRETKSEQLTTVDFCIYTDDRIAQDLWLTTRWHHCILLELCLWSAAVEAFDFSWMFCSVDDIRAGVSPSWVCLDLMSLALMLAPTMCEDLKSPTRNIRHSLSSRREMTAFRENTSVSARLFGWEIFTNMHPTWETEKRELTDLETKKYSKDRQRHSLKSLHNRCSSITVVQKKPSALKSILS